LQARIKPEEGAEKGTIGKIVRKRTDAVFF